MFFLSFFFNRETFNNGFFPTGMPTKINTWGRGDPVYGPQVWDDDSSSTSTDNKYRRQRYRDNDREPEMYGKSFYYIPYFS